MQFSLFFKSFFALHFFNRMMRIIESAREMQRFALEERARRRRIGVVPTMGYLHEGHASLIGEARAQSDIVITTIFVNPLQFAPNEDFSRYPRDLERDKRVAEAAGCDVLFTPTPEEIYPEGFDAAVSIGGVSAPFEGVSRPTHFTGVATVLLKLFALTQPDKTFFGQKDYQQCIVVKKLVRDLSLPHEIVVCPTKREADGLAMSSRNVYLTPEARAQAPVLYQALQTAAETIRRGERARKVIEERLVAALSVAPDLRIDYAAAADSETLAQPEVFAPRQSIALLVAARLGATRLIDNLLVEP
jgi:pantoate--beta-alanine ligase